MVVRLYLFVLWLLPRDINEKQMLIFFNRKVTRPELMQFYTLLHITEWNDKRDIKNMHHFIYSKNINIAT
jgi:hypothetical protein